MKKLHFDYCMKISYSEEVARCNFTIKCLPRSNDRQNVKQMDISISPPVDYSFGYDGFINKQIYGVNDIPHNEFQFRISGDVIAGLSDHEESGNESNVMIFRHPYGLNKAGKTIKQYHDGYNADISDDYDKAVDIMHKLNRDFNYESGTTNIKTTAEEAFAQGHGVCQDYAHIFIALMHLEKIPARYVTGLIIGEGASHAWVEIFYKGNWYGLDPTNDEIVSDKHIKIGVGRDAHDCTINRGIMHGGGLHSQDINVNVREIER